MQPRLSFVHTSPVHIATFDRLLLEAGSSVPVRHLVAEHLLDQARQTGVTPALRQQVEATIIRAAEEAGVVVCTCSTIGALAEQTSDAAGCPVLRVDRVMAEQAVRVGRRILVATALDSTRAPTEALLQEAAAQAHTTVELIHVNCADAWPHFERGDQAAYVAAITARLRAAAPGGDLIVLAQASMAAAADACADLDIPILSSPKLGVEAALAMYQLLVGSTISKTEN